MTLNGVKLGRAVIFMKYFASVVSLIFVPKTLIWNKITFPVSNSLNFGELVENLHENLPIFLFLSNLLLLILKILRAYN